MPMRRELLASLFVLTATVPMQAQPSNPISAIFSGSSGVSKTNPFAAAPSGAASTGSTTKSTPSSTSLTSIFSTTMSNKQSSGPMMQKATLPAWSITNFMPTHAAVDLRNPMLGRTNGGPAPASQTLIFTQAQRPQPGFWSFLPWNKK